MGKGGFWDVLERGEGRWDGAAEGGGGEGDVNAKKLRVNRNNIDV